MSKPPLNIILFSSNKTICNLWKQQYCSYKSSKYSHALSVNVNIQNGYLQDLDLSNVSSQTVNSTDDKPMGVSCFVSPANSFAYMNGGYDLHLARLFSPHLPNNEPSYKAAELFIKNQILKTNNGYLPSNNSVLVDFVAFSNPKAPLDHHSQEFLALSDAWQKFKARYILMVPTMKTPKKLTFSSNQDKYNFIFDLCWDIFSKVQTHNQDCLQAEPDKFIYNIIIPALGAGYGGIEPEIVAKATIYALVIFYATLLSPIQKSFYAMKFLNEKNYRSLLVNGEVEDEDVEKLAEGYLLYNHEQHEKSKDLLLKQNFNIEKDTFDHFFIDLLQ